jgi:hypothetical protein
MKVLPKGEVMLGGELFDKMQVSFVTRTLLSFLMKFAMSLNPFLHFGFGDDHKQDGMFEFPHFTFPLFRVMDRVVVTPENETPPELGKELPESDQDRGLRRNGKGPHMNFQNGYIYTFSFHSMYVDFTRWVICNFPGYRAIDLRGFLGQQKVKIVVYELRDPNAQSDEESAASKTAYAISSSHFNAYKNYLLSMEMSHTSIMSPEELLEADEELAAAEDDHRIHPKEGEGEEEDNQEDHEMNEEVEVFNRNRCESGSSDDLDMERSVGPNEPEDSSHNHRNTDNADTALGISSDDEFVLANSVVSLVSVPPPWEEDHFQEQAKDSYTGYCSDHSIISLGDVAGAVMRKECQDVTIVRFVRPPSVATSSFSSTQAVASSAFRYPLTTLRRASFSAMGYSTKPTQQHTNNHSEESSDTNRSNTLSDDHSSELDRTNILRSGDEVMIQCASTGRYMTVHHGWWVNWTPIDLGSKSLFSINVMSASGNSYTPKGQQLVAGKAFRLRSVRWADWEVSIMKFASLMKLITYYL